MTHHDTNCAVLPRARRIDNTHTSNTHVIHGKAHTSNPGTRYYQNILQTNMRVVTPRPAACKSARAELNVTTLMLASDHPVCPFSSAYSGC